MTRIEFIPGNDGPQVRVIGRLRGGVLDLLLEPGPVASALDLTGVSEIDDAAKSLLVHRLQDRSGPVICPGWLALWVEQERARLAAEDAACERPACHAPSVGEPGPA
jgi:hypothetical protein